MSGQSDMDSVLTLTWEDIERAAEVIVRKILSTQMKVDTVIAIARGGLVPGRIVAGKLGVENIAIWHPNHGIIGALKGQQLVVDDIVDSGKTIAAAGLLFGGGVTAALLSRKKYAADFIGCVLEPGDKRFVLFPWESLEEEKKDIRWGNYGI